MSLLYRIAKLLCGLLLVAASASAQGWALPAKTPDTTVTCAGCPNTPDGEVTVGYKAPLSFTGRFLDSQGTTDWQLTFRTARAWNVQVVGSRIYFRIGSSVAAYNVSTFFDRLRSGESLMSSSSIYPPQQREGRPEEFLRWDEFFYPEHAIPSWVTPRVDGQDRLVAFDVDDQGYVYVAAGMFGWGIVKDAGGNVGQSMRSQFQRLVLGDQAPSVIAALKGSKQYAVVSGGKRITTVWDVTARTAPTLMRTYNFQVVRWAKTSDRFALTNEGNDLSIYSSDGLATGAPPLAAFIGDYRGLASDGVNFFAFAKDMGTFLSVFRPVGSTYVEQKFPLPYQNFTILRYGAGYLVGAGLNGDFRWDARLYKLGANQQPTEVPLIAHGPSSPIGYVQAYYTGAPGFAAPTGTYINITDALVYRAPDGKTYFIICAKGIGDVYELAGGETPVPVPTPTPVPVPVPQPPTPVPTPVPTPQPCRPCPDIFCPPPPVCPPPPCVPRT